MNDKITAAATFLFICEGKEKGKTNNLSFGDCKETNGSFYLIIGCSWEGLAHIYRTTGSICIVREDVDLLLLFSPFHFLF